MQYDSQEIKTNVKEMSCTVHIKRRKKKNVYLFVGMLVISMYKNNFVDHWYAFS